MTETSLSAVSETLFLPLYALALAIVSTVVRWLILPREKPSVPSS